jgi:hypothetical protein
MGRLRGLHPATAFHRADSNENGITMSDREFESYLTLLANLLRLDPKQRGDIGDELRSHLEDRLDELMARGVSREDAVEQALAEFGDAAGLAGQFLAVQRNRKRRWLMRVTTFSIAATILVAASITVFWPGRNAGPGAAVVIAQGPADVDPFGAQRVAQPDPFAQAPRGTEKREEPARANVPLSAAKRIERELDKTCDVEFVETPLKDVVAYLQEMRSIPILLNTKKLEEASVSPDTPVTKQLRGISLRSVLNLILEDLELTYVVRDEVLQITTPSDAQGATEIRIYDCRDILAMPAAIKEKPAATPGGDVGGMPGNRAGGFGTPRLSEHEYRAQQLMTIITTNIDPNTWRMSPGLDAQTPGNGTISEYNGLIVVTQTAQTHNKIERVLDMLREAAGLAEPKTGKVVR